MSQLRTFFALAVTVVLWAGPVWPSMLDTIADDNELPSVGISADAEQAVRSQIAALDGSFSEELADALDALVEILTHTDRAGDLETVELAGRAVSVRREQATNPIGLVPGLVRLGEVLTAAKDLEGAEEALIEAEGLVRVTEVEVYEHGRILNRLAAVRQAQRNKPEAAKLFAAALAELDHSSNAGDTERDIALVGLGRSAYGLRDLDTARMAFQRLIEERVAAVGPEDAGVAEAFHKLAVIETAAGEVETAGELCRHSLDIFERALGPDDSEVGSVLNSLARVVLRQGDYLEALLLSERAIAIYEKSLGPEHPYVAGMLNNLAGILIELGDLSAARQAHERALAIREMNMGPESVEVAQSLSNLGAVVLHEGDSERAVLLLDRALAIREEKLGFDSREVGLTLLNLGWALDESHNLERARAVLERSVAVLERYPAYSTSLGDALNNLALVQLQQDLVDDADFNLDRARGLYEDARGHNNPRTAAIVLNQSKAAAFGGRVDVAVGLALESVRIGREHLQLTAAGLSEREALKYADNQTEKLDLVLSLVVDPKLDDPTLVAASWDEMVRSRGLVLDEMAGRRRLLEAGSTEVGPLAGALQSAASHLSRHLVEGRGPGSIEEIRIARLELERAERDLGEASLPFARSQARMRLGLDDVFSSLPSDSALVAYARFERRFTQDPLKRLKAPESWYLAFIRSPSGGVEVLPLADAPTIDRLVRRWRAAANISTGGESAMREAGELLRRAIWDPVTSRCENAPRVVIIPDGELGLLNFAALPVGGGFFLVEQGPLLVTIGQELDLIPDPLEKNSGPCLLVFGDPDFNSAPTGSASAAIPSSRPGPSTSGGLSGVQFAALPATAGEASVVAALWTNMNSRSEALRLTGGDASEDAFKTLAPDFRVLHVATHGFFLGGAMTLPSGQSRGVGALVPGVRVTDDVGTEDPLQLSGLAFAGANHRGVAPGEDGVLTAGEIAALDLSGVEWAVLSACDSGVGEVSAREGVFGLQRAFKIAGARTVIMSLWAVDDAAASEWMRALYRAHLLDGLPTAEAVRQANLEIIGALRGRGDGANPSSWAPFVALGDGR